MVLYFLTSVKSTLFLTEYLKQQDSITQDFEEKGLFDCGMQING